ncbi:MAG: S1 RNA-binding domain-containing protein [Pirellulaceae bacterium]
MSSHSTEPIDDVDQTTASNVEPSGGAPENNPARDSAAPDDAAQIVAGESPANDASEAESGTPTSVASQENSGSEPAESEAPARNSQPAAGRPNKIQIGRKRPQMLPNERPAKPMSRPASPSHPAAKSGPAQATQSDDADESADLAAAVTPSTASLPRAGQRIEPPSKRAPLPPELELEMEAAFADTDMAQLIAKESLPTEPLEPESRHRGRVLRMDDENVFLSLGGPNEAIVPMRLFAEPPEVGATLEVVVKQFNAEDGLYEAAIPGAALDVADWSDIVEGSVVEARVSGSNTGGLECKVNNIPAFIPASQVARFRVEDFSDYVDQKLLCIVTEANPNRRNLVLSHRAYLEREREAERKQLLESLEPGQTREGVVRNVRDFGVFVDLGGVDGLIHVSQLSWDRIKHPSEVLKEGDKIRVRVERIDAETGKIGLAYRDLQDHPWTDASARFPVGGTLTGHVSRIAKFGAFVKLAPGVEGLIHISELSHQRVANVSNVVSEGQEVQVKILSVDSEAQRIGLSIKELHAKPASESAETGESEAEEEAPVEPRTPKYTGPLRGGTERSTGGDQFGLRW